MFELQESPGKLANSAKNRAVERKLKSKAKGKEVHNQKDLNS